MNYYKSNEYPSYNVIQCTVNGDYYYYGTDILTDDVEITKEQFLVEKAKEIHVEEQPNPKLDQASTLLADLLAQQEQDILNELEGVLNE